MTGPAADAEPGTLDGGDAVSRLVQASDGVELHCLRWRGGRSPPWAVVVFLHGIASHGGWFAETAADLDRRRAWPSMRPTVAGRAAAAARAGTSTATSAPSTTSSELVRLVAAEHPGTPVFLAASSWAAKLGVVYASRRPAPLSGLLLLGPGLLPTVSLSRTRQLVVVAGHLVAPTARLAIPLTPELYTANPRYLDFIRADPLRLLKATTRFFWETARLDRRRARAAAGLAAPAAPAPGRGRRDDGRGRHAALVLPARRRGQDLPGLSRRRPHPGLRAGPQPVPGRPARLAVGPGPVGGRRGRQVVVRRCRR